LIPLRTLNLKEKIKNRGFIFKLQLRLLRFFWIFPLQQFFFTLQLFKLWPLMKGTKPPGISGTVLLGTSIRADKIAFKTDWTLTVPWITLRNNKTSLDLFTLLTKIDLLKNYFWSIKYSFIFGVRHWNSYA